MTLVTGVSWRRDGPIVLATNWISAIRASRVGTRFETPRCIEAWISRSLLFKSLSEIGIAKKIAESEIAEFI